jgi:excisionase family DNA binding protein
MSQPRSSGGASPAPLPSRLLTVHELAGLLQVPPKTIYTWRYKGVGPPAVPIGRYLRFRAEDVATWLDNRAEGSGPGAIGVRRRPRLRVGQPRLARPEQANGRNPHERRGAKT